MVYAAWYMTMILPLSCAVILIHKPALTVSVRAAVDAGGCDNVTVIVVDVHSKTGQARTIKRAKRKYRTLAICIALAIVAVFALGAFGAYTYVNNSAYLVAEDGKVSVYRGIPDTFLGMQLSHLEQTTDIPG